MCSCSCRAAVQRLRQPRLQKLCQHGCSCILLLLSLMGVARMCRNLALLCPVTQAA